MVGLAATVSNAKVISQALDEFQRIVLLIVTCVIIPILPVFISTTFCTLAYEGTITKQLPVFLIVVIIVMIGHYIWLGVLYGLAGAYSGVILGCSAQLRSRLHYCCRHHVFGCYAGCRTALREEV